MNYEHIYNFSNMHNNVYIRMKNDIFVWIVFIKKKTVRMNYTNEIKNILHLYITIIASINKESRRTTGVRKKRNKLNQRVFRLFLFPFTMQTNTH